MCRWTNIVLLFTALVFCGCKTAGNFSAGRFSRFVGLEQFSGFISSTNKYGEQVLDSPAISAGIAWNQLVVSWNAHAPVETFVDVETRVIKKNIGQTKFYSLGDWSLDGKIFPRTSIRNQKDADGTVDTDTLILNQPTKDAVQVRLTLGGTHGAMPELKFLGISFANTKVPPATRSLHRAAWGKIIPTPEHSQHGYTNESGWCSPAALAMVLARWSEILDRPEINLTVPQVAAAVYDQGFAGTGNWPFNTAFAGSFSGIRGYVTRFDDLSEVEDWIAAGIPVILSARWDQLEPGRPLDSAGHLIVCIGFTKNGDVVVNDPATRLELHGESVQRIYRREKCVSCVGKITPHVVYLVYPENVGIPRNEFGHWQTTPASP